MDTTTSEAIAISSHILRERMVYSSLFDCKDWVGPVGNSKEGIAGPQPRCSESAHLRKSCQQETGIWKRCIFYPGADPENGFPLIVFPLIAGDGNKLHTGRCSQRFPQAVVFTALPP